MWSLPRLLGTLPSPTSSHINIRSISFRLLPLVNGSSACKSFKLPNQIGHRSALVSCLPHLRTPQLHLLWEAITDKVLTAEDCRLPATLLLQLTQWRTPRGKLRNQTPSVCSQLALTGKGEISTLILAIISRSPYLH